MLRRDISNEAGARSDGLMIVSVIFIAAFTFIAFTTSPVYTGVGWVLLLIVLLGDGVGMG